MKRLIYIFPVIFFFVLCSCTRELENPVSHEHHTNTVLTDSIRYLLESAADSIFMRVSTPGMMAMFSAEGDNDIIIRRGVGNLTTGESINPYGYFRIASNTKTFTGLAVLILTDEGKINLDSSISYYLPEDSIPNGSLIKIRNLGNMTSGLYNYSDDVDFWMDFQSSGFTKTYPPDSLLKVAFRHPVHFPPGTDYEYCNTNTVILGLLIEKVTGLSADQVIYSKVLKPAGLSQTYWPFTVFLPAPYIHGYSSAYGSLTDATNWNPSWGYTAGILISNFSDMKHWPKIVADGTFLSSAMKAERFNWVRDHYGFCVMKAGNWVGHPGSIFGYNSHFFYHTTKKITMLILTNTADDSPVEYFSDAFRNIIGN